MKKLLAISLIIAATCSISFPLDASGLFMGGIFSGGINIPTFLNPFSKKDNKTKDNQTIEKDFKVSPGKRLDMDLIIGGTIIITGWDKDELSAKVIKAGKDDEDCKIGFEENSDGIKINSEYEGDNKDVISTDMTFEIKVPKRFDINIDALAGSVSIDGVEGRMTGETKGGMISLNNIKGDLELRTMGGNIDLRNSDADGTVTTMGGDVTINDVKGDVKGTSMGGNVTYTHVTRRDNTEMENAKMDKEVNISSMGRDINVDDAPYGAIVSTMGGDIKVGSVRQFIKAKTMGGDIEINEADGSVNATTMSGDVKVKVLGNANSTGRDVKLNSMSGDITLYVPSDFSMDIDIKIYVPENRPDKHKIYSDFDLNIQEKKFNSGWYSSNKWHSNIHHRDKGKRIEANGSINGGKNHIEIVTMNGNVYFKKI